MFQINQEGTLPPPFINTRNICSVYQWLLESILIKLKWPANSTCSIFGLNIQRGKSLRTDEKVITADVSSRCFIETSTQIGKTNRDHSIYSTMESKDWTNSKQSLVRHAITANNSIKPASKVMVQLLTYVWLYFMVYKKKKIIERMIYILSFLFISNNFPINL